MHATNDAESTMVLVKKRVDHWENDSLSRWDLSLDLNAVTLNSPEMAGGRELSRVGARKEKDLSP